MLRRDCVLIFALQDSVEPDPTAQHAVPSLQFKNVAGVADPVGLFGVFDGDSHDHPHIRLLSVCLDAVLADCSHALI